MSCQSMMGVVWPDGKPLLEQPLRLRLAFSLISRIEAKCQKKGKS